MKIEELEAGRDMDAWVAVNVMNFDWATGDYNLIPLYSTDIAAAWQVVEKMRGQWDCAINRLWTDVLSEWSASFARAGDYSGWITHTADTAPLAICRAALLACGITEVPD